VIISYSGKRKKIDDFVDSPEKLVSSEVSFENRLNDFFFEMSRDRDSLFFGRFGLGFERSLSEDVFGLATKLESVIGDFRRCLKGESSRLKYWKGKLFSNNVNDSKGY
jgi:hypothetical protein